MLQEFITESISPSALRSAEIVGRRNFRVPEFPSSRTSKKCRSESPYYMLLNFGARVLREPGETYD